MSDHDSQNARLLAEVADFLATPRTPAPLNPPGQIGERVLPSISVKTLRDQYGSPDAMLAVASERIREASTVQGPFGRPSLEDALDLIALARWWMKQECWRPIPMELRNASSHVVIGKRVAFHRETTKKPAWYSRLLRGDSA